MPFYIVNGMAMHIKFARGKAPAPCVARVGMGQAARPCCDISSFLCDWPMHKGGTCSAPLCQAHANQVGRNRHHCPQHQAEALRAQPQLGLFTSLEGIPS